MQSTLTDPATLDALHTAQRRLRAEIAKVIVGQDEIIKHVIVCLLARGHVLLIGVPAWPRPCSSAPSRKPST